MNWARRLEKAFSREVAFELESQPWKDLGMVITMTREQPMQRLSSEKILSVAGADLMKQTSRKIQGQRHSWSRPCRDCRLCWGV